MSGLYGPWMQEPPDEVLDIANSLEQQGVRIDEVVVFPDGASLRGMVSSLHRKKQRRIPLLAQFSKLERLFRRPVHASLSK